MTEDSNMDTDELELRRTLNLKIIQKAKRKV